MKIITSRVQDVDLSHDDLVNLLSFCTDGGDGTFGLDYRKKDYLALPEDVRSDNDCLEDKAAKILEAGGKIRIEDWDAEGDAYEGAGLKADIINEVAYYPVTLKAIKDGLVRAANGEVIHALSDRQDLKYIRKCFDRFADEECEDFDADDAKTLWQVILFNELIYG